MYENKDKWNRGFWSSECFSWSEIVSRQKMFDGFTQEDLKNRAEIMAIYHRDPFAEESIADRPQLYEDLKTMTTDDMAEDLPKQMAAIEIVRSYYRVNRINTALVEMQATTELMIQNGPSVKLFVEQKQKELAAITQLSKDHGFAEKYASSRQKGSGTLSAIVRDMDREGYDKGAVNKFNIQTAEAISQVFDISFKSIMSQLNLTADDYAQMVAKQAKEMRDMRDIMDQQAEELRLLKEEVCKFELIENYKKTLEERKINPDDIDRLVKEQQKWTPLISTTHVDF